MPRGFSDEDDEFLEEDYDPTFGVPRKIARYFDSSRQYIRPDDVYVTDVWLEDDEGYIYTLFGIAVDGGQYTERQAEKLVSKLIAERVPAILTSPFASDKHLYWASDPLYAYEKDRYLKEITYALQESQIPWEELFKELERKGYTFLPKEIFDY